MTKDLILYYILLFDKYSLKTPEPTNLAKYELETLKLIFAGDKNVKLALHDWHEIEKLSKDSVFIDLKFFKYVRIIECLKDFHPLYISEFYQSIIKGSSSLTFHKYLKNNYQNENDLLKVTNCYCQTFSLLAYKNFINEEFKSDYNTFDEPPVSSGSIQNINKIISENKFTRDFSDETKPSTIIHSFQWQKNLNLIEVLYENLVFIESPLISPKTPKETFIRAFSGENLTDYPQIIWNDSKNLLAYFIYNGLMKKNFIYKKTEYNSIIEKSRVFVKPNGKSFTGLKQAIQEYQNSKLGKPRGSEEIDQIMEILINF